MESERSLIELDRAVAQTFLHAPNTMVTYAPMPIRNEQHRIKDSNSQIVPMYCDLIVDTVTDYDIFYPLARETQRFFSPPKIRPNVTRLDEVAVSVDFPYDDDFSRPTDPYYFHTEPEYFPSSNFRYLRTPFFWFHPVLNHNYAICIPTNRSALHVYTPNTMRF